MRSLIVMVTIYGMVLGLDGSTAQTAVRSLSIIRATVLASPGKAVDRNLPLFPLAAGTGTVFVQPVHEQGAAALKIHFKMLTTSNDPWRIVVRKGSHRWEHAGPSHPASDDSDFWSDEIESADAIVEVYASKEGMPLKLTIDKVSIRPAQHKPQSITGRNDLMTIIGQDPWIVELGKSVALIRFVADDGNDYVCTGFLASTTLLLTNEHCISSASEARSAVVVFDFDSPANRGTEFRASGLEYASHDLDYAVVRLATAPGRAPLRLLTAPAVEGETLLMIEHPGGEFKQVSIKDCRVSMANVVGRSAWSNCPDAGMVALRTDFGHECDSKPGSSGSPVFDWAARAVVGLHHLGFCPDGKLINKAVNMQFVLDDLRAKRPNLFTELSISTAEAVAPGPHDLLFF